MSFVISANYLDRQSPFRWLVRRADEPLESARACRQVKCGSVRFKKSGTAPEGKGEAGFGCAVIAVAEHAEGLDFQDEVKEQPEQPKDNRKKLEFSYDSFYDQDSNKVTEAKTLELGPHGEILATL